MPYASKWQSLGLALSLDDDRLDEIFTNNETNEACLQEMLELYMMRSDRNHNWEEIEAALERIANGELHYSVIIQSQYCGHAQRTCTRIQSISSLNCPQAISSFLLLHAEWPDACAAIALAIQNEYHWCQTLGTVKFIEIVVTYSDDVGDIIH